MASEIIKRDANFITLLGAITNNAAQNITQLRVDSITQRLLVDAITTLEGSDTVGDGSVTVVVAGTRVQFSDQSCKKVFVQAYDGNTGTVVIGGSTVVAAGATRRGKAFFPGQGDWFNVSNLNLLYVDALNAGDKIIYYYEN